MTPKKTAEEIAEEMVTSWQLVFLDAECVQDAREAFKADIMAALRAERARVWEEAQKIVETCLVPRSAESFILREYLVNTIRARAAEEAGE